MAYVGAARTVEDEPIYLASRRSDAGRSIRPEIRRRYYIYYIIYISSSKNRLTLPQTRACLNIILLPYVSVNYYTFKINVVGGPGKIFP